MIISIICAEIRAPSAERQRLLLAFGARRRRCASPPRRAARARCPAPPPDRGVADALRERVGDFEPLRQAVQPGRVVVGETLGRRRPPQRLAEQVCDPRRCGAISAPLMPVARSTATIHSPGRLILACSGAQDSGAVDQRLGDLLEVAVGIEEALGQPLHQRRRRIVGDEMGKRDFTFCAACDFNDLRVAKIARSQPRRE